MFDYRVKVTPYKGNPSSAFKAFADVIVDDILVIKGFKILSGPRGLFVIGPQTEYTDKEGALKRSNIIEFTDSMKNEEGYSKSPILEEIKNTILREYENMGPARTSRGAPQNGSRGSERGQRQAPASDAANSSGFSSREDYDIPFDKSSDSRPRQSEPVRGESVSKPSVPVAENRRSSQDRKLW